MRRGTPVTPCIVAGLAFLALAAGACLPGASAQATQVVLVTDEAGDQVVTPGPLATSPPAFDDIDLIALSAAQPSQGTLVLTVTTTAAASASENLTIAFAVAKGPSSLPNSTASGQAYSLLYHDGAVKGVTGATAATAGKDVTVTIPLAAIGAVGGDLLTNVTARTEDYDPGAAPAPITQDDASATDRAPDTGTSTAYTFERPPTAGNLQLRVTGGTLGGVAFDGAQVRTADRNASVAFHLQLSNLGLDPDTVSLATAPAIGAQVAIAPSTLPIPPGASATATFTVTLANAANGTLAFTVTATSAHGGQVQAQATVTVAVPAAPPHERTPQPAALKFLSPLVTAVGLDKVFGDFAELAFTLFVLLLGVVAVYLSLFLVKTPWVRVRVTPRKAVVAPGGVAEFHVEMLGRKARPSLARATLRSEGPWTAGLQVGRSAARPGESMDIPLESGAEALPQEAVLRVQVPYDAPARDRQELEFDVVPVDSEGGTHPKHASRAKVTVEAAAPAVGKYASARDIRLADVKHDPPDPRPGATVRTTAAIHNDGGVVARLRIVLQKDGKAVAEETVDVPPHDSKVVALPWTAGAGRNLVKVQIFLA